MIYEYCAASDSDLAPPTFRHTRLLGNPRTRRRTYDFTLHNLLATGSLCEEVLAIIPRCMPLYVMLGTLEAGSLVNVNRSWERMVISEHRVIKLGILPRRQPGSASVRDSLWAFCEYYEDVQRTANPLKILHIDIDDFLRQFQVNNDATLLEDLEEWIDELSNEIMMKTWLDCGQNVDRAINARLGAPNGVSRAVRRGIDAIIRMRRHWN